ncbi:MAG: hypothetical protein ACLFQV_14040, partial [Vulcanimicrobiota bacterium]
MKKYQLIFVAIMLAFTLFFVTGQAMAGVVDDVNKLQIIKENRYSTDTEYIESVHRVVAGSARYHTKYANDN